MPKPIVCSGADFNNAIRGNINVFKQQLSDSGYINRFPKLGKLALLTYTAKGVFFATPFGVQMQDQMAN